MLKYYKLKLIFSLGNLSNFESDLIQRTSQITFRYRKIEHNQNELLTILYLSWIVDCHQSSSLEFPLVVRNKRDVFLKYS